MQLPPTVLSVTKDSKTKFNNKKAKHSASAKKKTADSKNKEGQKFQPETVADSGSEEINSNSEEEEPKQAQWLPLKHQKYLA